MSPHTQHVINAAFFLLCFIYMGQLMRWFFGGVEEDMLRANEARHMRSGGMRTCVDKDGKLHIETNGDERDHAQRCADSLNDWYYEKTLLRWYPVTRAIPLFVLYFFTSFR